MQEVLSAPQLDLPTRMDAMRVQAAIAVRIGWRVDLGTQLWQGGAGIVAAELG